MARFPIEDPDAHADRLELMRRQLFVALTGARDALCGSARSGSLPYRCWVRAVTCRRGCPQQPISHRQAGAYGSR